MPFGRAARAQRQLAIVSSAVQRDARCKLTAEGFNETGKHCCVVGDCYWREGGCGGVGTVGLISPRHGRGELGYAVGSLQ